MFCLTLRPIARAALLAAMLLPALAAASDVDEVQKLMQKGSYKEALTLADKAIASKPRDANLRFLKGVLLAQLDRKQEAAVVFTGLTQDFPTLAEPYNNLGVLLAGSGELDRAREVLLRATQVAPAYATAHENLGDLYARLSAQSYEKASQLDGASAKAKSKLALARDLSNAAVSGSAPASVAAAPRAAPVPAQAAAEASMPPARSPAKQAIVVNGASSPAPAAATAAQAAASPEEKAVLEAVRKWAQAWSARDISQYLASYASDFHPANGADLETWKAERKKRIEGRDNIQVQVLQPAVKVDGKEARVKFMQVYESGKLKSRDVKELVLTRDGQNWLIREENVKG